MLNEGDGFFESFSWTDVRFVKTPPSWTRALGIIKECLMTGVILPLSRCHTHIIAHCDSGTGLQCFAEESIT